MKRKNPRPAGYKGWLKRRKNDVRDETLYVYKNSVGLTRSKSLGPSSMDDVTAWAAVTREGYHLLAGTPDPELITFGELRRAWELDGKTHSGEPKSKGTLATEKRNGRLHLSKFDDIAAVSLRPKKVKDWLATKSQDYATSFATKSAASITMVVAKRRFPVIATRSKTWAAVRLRITRQWYWSPPTPSPS
jgi:hypothetical protein